MTIPNPDPSQIYQLNVTLDGSKPPIWRRLQVRGSTRLSELHTILQRVMGWEDAHLHEFSADDAHYSDPYWGLDADNEYNVALDQIVSSVGDRFAYEYDFGDGWQHDVEVEKLLTPEAGVAYPVCLAGARACPPEDCGGIFGYENLLQALADPRHPDHETLTDWLGGGFDPEAFDLDAINRALRG